jgi:SAM-dependent methyltransferase
VECKNCRLIRLNPLPTVEELKSYYPRNYWFSPDAGAASRLEETYRRLVLRDHVQFVTQALKASGAQGPVIDIGCGGGLFLRILRERGYAAVGLDNSTSAASLAWKRNGVPVLCGDLTASPLDRGCFSLVSMFHVLEHVYDPVAYLRTARDLLSLNGRLVVQVPNAASWQFLVFGEHWNGVDVPRHLVNYRQRDLENLLDYCGFEVLRRKHFSLRDNPAGFATSLAPSLDPMARRVRSAAETPAVRLLKDCAYLALTVAALPFAVLEAACGAGSSIMIEARKKS